MPSRNRAALRLVASLLLGVAILAADPRPSPAASPLEAGSGGGGAEIVPGRVLIQTRPGAEHDRLRGLARAGEVRSLRGDLHVVAVPPGQERARAADLRRDPSVVAAAPNYRRRAQLTPNDPLYAQQWAPARVEAPAAWDVTTGSSSVVIAIVDSGVDLGHPDLAGKLLPGRNTLDADPGSVDPSCAAGTSVQDDFQGHGTHVAGIAAAAGNNGVGVAGAAFGARILPIKVLDCTGSGSDAQLIAGIDWATANGAHVINLSIGGPGQSDVLDAAVARAHAAGVLVVAAAGNGGSAAPPYYPGASPKALAVSATDAADQIAPYSNQGAYVGLAAPGSSIISTYPTSLGGSPQPGYSYKSGTSMASPLVAGVAALVWHPALSPDGLATVLKDSADKVCPTGAASCAYDAAGRNDYYGHGRLNAGRAVQVRKAASALMLPRAVLPLLLRDAAP